MIKMSSSVLNYLCELVSYVILVSAFTYLDGVDKENHMHLQGIILKYNQNHISNLQKNTSLVCHGQF